MARQYYSVRKDKYQLSIQALKSLFLAILEQLREKHYLVEAEGFECVDLGQVPGIMGLRPEIYVLRHLRKPDLWPPQSWIDKYSEDDLFDVIELLHDLVSKPIAGEVHSYNGCGMHWEVFDRMDGQEWFRQEINSVLCDYQGGFELTSDGEIVETADTGLEPLISARLPRTIEADLERKLDEAIRLYRRRNASLGDRRNAVRTLGDIFEQIRPRLKEVISKNDESDLFNILNNFQIRHHNERQKTAYDEALWLSWMFYFYLATLHLAVRKFAVASEKSPPNH